MTYSNRYGTFTVDGYFIHKRPEDAIAALAGCIIVKAEPIPFMDAIQYWAIHPDFDECKQGEMAPEYLVQFEKLQAEDGEPQITRKFIRRTFQ
jgi:hypothetical protein